MDQIPAAMDKHLEVVQCHRDGGILLGASSLTGRYWLGSLWFYRNPDLAPDVEKCTAGVQLEAGLSDARWVDTTKVFVGLDTGGVALWELTDDYHTFIQQSSATEHDDIVSTVCVCADGKKAISASHDRSIKLWDLETFSSTNTYTVHADKVLCVQNHPTEPDVFLSSSQDGRVFLWDTRKQKPVKLLDKSPLEGVPTCVAWQPDSHTYAVGSEAGQLVVKDTRAAVGSPLTTTPHTRSVCRLQFSPTRPSLLGSVSEDGTVVVTSLQDECISQIYRSSSHSDFVQGISWSKSDLKLYTCGWDARLLSHVVTDETDAKSPSEPEVTKMEVNGHPEEVPDSKPDPVSKPPVLVNNLSNGDGVDVKHSEEQTT